MTTNYLQQHAQAAWTWEQAAMAPNHLRQHFQVEIDREYMFEKTLTPSDVGKLNRLVIPKQNAEKYLPEIHGNQTGENGRLLDFEDEAGKTWCFRYSYWSSSQSYVLTKGWSRFVKEKGLDAGNVVVFQRHHSGNVLYIGCRKHGEVGVYPNSNVPVARNAVLPWSPSFYDSSAVQHDCHAGDQIGSVTGSSAHMQPPVNSRRLRLFGVNLDCGPEQ